MSEKRFLSVSDTAKELGVSVGTITSAIDAGKLPALRLSDSHQSTRIPRTALFPDEQQTKDLKIERLRRLQADVIRTGEERARRLEAFRDADLIADEAIRKLSDELAMQDVETARDALKKAS